MKQKLKILLSVYAVFQLVLACRCPDPTYYEWEVESMICWINYDYSDSTVHVNIRSDSTSSQLIGKSFLDDFGPTKAIATSPCRNERFYLKTLFDGISIKSNSTFSISEPAGTELKDKFNFDYSCCSDSVVTFEEVMNDMYNEEWYYNNLNFNARLIQLPSIDSLHTFTFTFYLDGGDSIVSVTNELDFSLIPDVAIE